MQQAYEFMLCYGEEAGQSHESFPVPHSKCFSFELLNKNGHYAFPKCTIFKRICIASIISTEYEKVLKLDYDTGSPPMKW